MTIYQYHSLYNFTLSNYVWWMYDAGAYGVCFAVSRFELGFMFWWSTACCWIVYCGFFGFGSSHFFLLSRLNVGGDTSFVTRRDTLTAIEGSRLSQLFSGRWDKVLPKDRDGRIFLDLDPVQFRALLSWLVDTKRMAPGSGQGPPLKAVPLEYQAGFLELCELLCSNNEGRGRSERDDSVMFTSQILSSEDQQRLKNWIQHESCPSKRCIGNLLFRATRDGFAAAKFHQKCDGKGPTVVIAKSAGGHIFGGYSDTAWDSSNQYKHCRDSFLFRLSGPGGVGSSQHRIFRNFQNGIYCGSTYGPTFGSGQDMLFTSNSQVNFSLGTSYDSNGTGGNFTFLAESQNAIRNNYFITAKTCITV